MGLNLEQRVGLDLEHRAKLYVQCRSDTQTNFTGRSEERKVIIIAPRKAPNSACWEIDGANAGAVSRELSALSAPKTSALPPFL
ncbi:hypothetical protein AKJ09_02788 [Labilithrix luteola]|uniref:Uncharacterized protein n=1 Tax=Labilithrix luteola TaxID=1391654 RepID=A0A0K1PSM2_9BACT|nr:hypothetical protein AKJ09_02788 [Labilithrix luteola]